MRAFRMKLVEQLVHAPGTLTRNRNFDTFDDADGRAALRISRHLKALGRDILSPGARPAHEPQPDGRVVLRLALGARKATRVAYLSRREFEILLGLPGVREAFGV